MSIIDLFRSDTRRAINATPLRRLASFGSMALLVVLVVLFSSTAPWWLWLALLLVEAVVFIILGNVWAGRDALDRDLNDKRHR